MSKRKKEFISAYDSYLARDHTVKSLKKGEFFRLPGKNMTYIKGEYDRGQKRYEAIKTNDVFGNPRYLKGSTKVDIKFEY